MSFEGLSRSETAGLASNLILDRLSRSDEPRRIGSLRRILYNLISLICRWPIQYRAMYCTEVDTGLT